KSSQTRLIVNFSIRYSKITNHQIKWRGSATKASMRSRRSRGSRDTIYFYIGVRIFHDTDKECLLLLFSSQTRLIVNFSIRYSKITNHQIKWRGSATKASMRSRRSRGSRDTIYFYIGVRIFHDTDKECLLLL
ncbi:hypothetical protein TSAR_008983, partial [Trichomalopsis sarcophagae]